MRFSQCNFVLAILTGIAGDAAARPNIVILYADDLGYGDVAVLNPESKIPTPHLDRLAAEGLRCTDAHSSSCICTPSRYALLTGRYHWRKLHGIVETFGPPVFDETEITLPKLLRQHGYRTACIGKWHLGWNWNAIKRPGAEPSPEDGYASEDFDWTRPIPGGPLDHGFDYYFGDDVPNFPPYVWIENDRVLTAPTGPLKVDLPTLEGRWEARPGPMVEGWNFYAVMPQMTRRTVEWIAEHKGTEQPFFLYVPFTAPHAPIVPTAEFVGRSKAGGYGDFVVQTDAAVGAILEAIEEHGFSDNTLVVFSSDNGPEVYAFDRIRNFDHRSAGPLRGLKRDLWEGGHRVPFIVRWPGIIRRNSVSDALVSQVDLFATIAATAGIEIPDGAAEDSLNLLPTWADETPGPRRTIVHCDLKQRFAVRHDHWLLVNAETGAVNPIPDWFQDQEGIQSHDQPGELYDLRTDLGQRENLYQDHANKVSELRALLLNATQQ